MATALEPMSLRAYSRHRGVSLRAVQKAIAAGRIQPLADGKIDAATADSEWARNTAPRPQTKSSQAESVRPMPSYPAASPANDLEVASRPEGGAVEYSRARAIREGYLARISKIEFEERSARLVSRDEVAVQAFNKFRTFRDGMLNIPDRIAAVLAAESDATRVHEILTSEIRRALLEFSDAHR